MKTNVTNQQRSKCFENYLGDDENKKEVIHNVFEKKNIKENIKSQKDEIYENKSIKNFSEIFGI